MKTNLRRSNAKLFVAPFALLLLLSAICPHSAVAQTNTFPASGNVGIGTASPSARLHVVGSGNQAVTLQSTSAAIELQLRSNVTNGGNWTWGTGWSTPGVGKLYLYDNVGGATRLVVDTSGNVGIGTTTPSASYKLDVNGGINASGNINATGNITASGNIAAKYQDVAEWVPSAHSLPAGTVVTLDPTRSNHVEASSKSYDTRVAGVVSAQPGITLGERGEGKVLVATTGRVRIKVDASRASIQVGDLLVTSEAPGLAMKSKPIDIGGVQIHRPGTIIGKALEPLAKGRGEILVLLSLQ